MVLVPGEIGKETKYLNIMLVLLCSRVMVFHTFTRHQLELKHHPNKRTSHTFLSFTVNPSKVNIILPHKTRL